MIARRGGGRQTRGGNLSRVEFQREKGVICLNHRRARTDTKYVVEVINIDHSE